jgi:serine phosphatase RsbU (regulator of sigma subunit)/ligand-binding sensor domain-containing protein
MKAFRLFCLFLLCSASLTGQVVNKYGNPLLRNFIPEEYGAVEQNWSAIQDNRGVMYFGNNDNGILEYDGRKWRTIPIPNNSMVLSLAKDDNGTIYAGAIGEFGYLEPDIQGEMKFVSLNNFNRDSIKISNVYKTYFYHNKIYYCSPRYIIVYDKKTTKLIDVDKTSEYANLFSFNVNNHLYIGSFRKGLMELIDDKFVPAPNGSFFEKKNIYFILPNGENQIILGSDASFYNYNQLTGEVSPFNDKSKLISKVLDESIAYSAVIQPNGSFAFAFPYSTRYNYLEINKNGIPHEAINSSLGLKDGAVTSLYRSLENGNEQPLWLTHFNGITRAEIQSSLRKYGEESGTEGLIMDIIIFNGTMYLATSKGLFKQVEDNGFLKFIPDPNVTSQTWSFEIFNNPNTGKKSLLVASSSGIYEVNESGKLSLIGGKYKDVILNVGYKVYQSKFNPSIVYIGEQAGLSGYKLVNGSWELINNKGRIRKDDFKYNVRNIEEDAKGNLWLMTYVNGIAMYNPKNDSIKIFDSKNGLPNLNSLQVFRINNNLFFCTANGFYKFDYNTNKFIRTGLPNDSTQLVDYGVNKVVRTANGYVMACFNKTNNWIQTVTIDSSGRYTIDNTSFKRLPDKFSDAVFVDNDGIIWISKAKELYSYNPLTRRDYKTPFNTLIRKVLSKEDTVLFDGTFQKKFSDGHFAPTLTQQPEQILKLPYSFNKLVFEFSACFYENEEETLFSYFLEGSDETWSIWNKEAKATYTNLKEGSYKFKVKARNIYGTESKIAEYKFTISPPWSRTILAYIIYALLFIGLVWILVRWNTRRLIAEKEELEQIVKERTAEVVAQKDEIALQSEKISIQNEEIKSSIHYASRIQGAILTPNEQIQKIFDEYFILFLPRDIVSGDFYWITKVGTKKICVVADCTGHGVPGGFMSMLGMSFISQIISKGESFHPGDILNQLRTSVINSLHQTGEVGGSKDGMDIAIYVIDEVTNVLEFSGANNPLVHIRNNELNHIKSDKMPIGIHLRANEPFTTHTIELLPGDCVYTFSDGYADQFGGPDQRKFMIKNLKDLLLEIHQLPMPEQRERLHKNLLDWHGDSPRIDDVVVMGVRI